MRRFFLRLFRSTHTSPCFLAGALGPAAALLVMLPAPLSAEEAWAATGPLPPQRIEAILAGQGYVGISGLRRRGSVWVADVAERDGRRYRAVVDGASGEVSGLRAVPATPASSMDSPAPGVAPR
jgi:hypothetical protein